MVEDCPFCARSAEAVAASEFGIAYRDAFPLADGHTLVAPRRHAKSVFELSSREQADLWILVARVRDHLEKSQRPDGFTIGINDGEAAGQTIGHAHIHVIPRYAGDVSDPRGGIRHVIPGRARYWE